MERLPQGLSTSAGWFQKVMNEALHEVISDGHCMVFQDDIIIYTRDIDDHVRVLGLVLTALESINMAVRPTKCNLFKSSLKFLGHVVDQDGSRPSNENINTIGTFEQPKTVKQVRSFLGTVNFYRKFIPNITELADPLYCLLKKCNTKLMWGPEAEEAFQSLKGALMSAPLLIYPNFEKDFIIKTDASGIGIGAVLEQKNDEGDSQPIAFCSRKLNSAEKRYSAIEREALAIVYGLSQFKHLTYGYRIILQTDHRPLSYVFQLKDTNMRLVRWLLQVQDHNIVIEYKPGKFNFVADWLSRAYSDDTPLVTIAASHSGKTIDVEKIKKAQLEDQNCKGWMSRVLDVNDDTPEYAIDENGILIRKVIPARFNGWKYRVVVPAAMREAVISMYHDGLSGGHLSHKLTLWRIRLMFTWDGMARDTQQFITTCDNCQKRSLPRKKVPFQYVAPPMAPMKRISVDILGPFSLTKSRNKYIVVWVDHFSRMTFASPIKNMEAETIAYDYIKNIFPRYGASEEVISDRGGQFTSNIVKSLYRHLKMKGIHTTAYNPQSNGVTERVNSKILRVLSHLCEAQFNKWDELLPFVLQNLNNSVHRSTGESPFFVFHGFDQKHPGVIIPCGIDNADGGVPEVISQMVDQVNEARDRVMEQLSESSRHTNRMSERKWKPIDFMPGEKVLCLDLTSYSGKNRKLKERFRGPFRIIARVGVVNYKIRAIDGGQEDRVVHSNKLKRYFDRRVLDDAVAGN